MLLLVPVILLAAAQAGASAAPALENARVPAKDIRVCETVGEVGSRLKTHKVCMLRSEWAEQRRSDKMIIDRTQIQRGIEGGN